MPINQGKINIVIDCLAFLANDAVLNIRTAQKQGTVFRTTFSDAPTLRLQSFETIGERVEGLQISFEEKKNTVGYITFVRLVPQ